MHQPWQSPFSFHLCHISYPSTSQQLQQIPLNWPHLYNPLPQIMSYHLPNYHPTPTKPIFNHTSLSLNSQSLYLFVLLHLWCVNSSPRQACNHFFLDNILKWMIPLLLLIAQEPGDYMWWDVLVFLLGPILTSVPILAFLVGFYAKFRTLAVLIHDISMSVWQLPCIITTVHHQLEA